MDKIRKGILKGSIPGNVFGGVTMASRGVRSAIKFDGVSSYVDFGVHPGECFHSPDACSDGITYSMWLWLGDNSSKRIVIILDSGGTRPGYVGYDMKFSYRDRLVLKTSVKLGPNRKYQYRITDWNQDRWEHVSWIWHPTQGIRFYLNGCDTDPGATKGLAGSGYLDVQPNNEFPFILGDSIEKQDKRANMKLDDLYVWYKVLSEHDIWAVYINGWPQ